MHSINISRIYLTCPGQSYTHLVVQNKPQHPVSKDSTAKKYIKQPSTAVAWSLIPCPPDWRWPRLTNTNPLQIHTQIHPDTFHEDEDGGFLAGLLIPAQVTATMDTQSFEVKYSPHPINLRCFKRSLPVFSPPLCLVFTLASQVEGMVEWDDKLGLVGDDSGLGVAWNVIGKRVVILEGNLSMTELTFFSIYATQPACPGHDKSLTTNLLSKRLIRSISNINSH